ncbi:sigma-70 family RNA polymerase sigma factor [Nocardia colli]|uniref:Sigma-70 family RNA polymerase sigma factor n=1 Tax=Nocardia colli TaxID=2545717 RepID=A0A5N0EI47_9NOCA|nr:sigma-70 family RNA polymerase sigma factor [Nocardia colli]KAA8887041.1 sigma-70 family RNA polymerase sigma factor [Nocardia colli]
MSAPLDPAQARDISFAALLRVVLHECAQAPLTLLTAETKPAVIRIARGGAQREQAFAEMLVEAYESASEMLLARITKLTRSRVDADDIVQTAFMRVYARWPDHITDVEGLRKYLWTTAENLVKDAMVRAAKDRERLDSDGHERLSVLADQAGLPFDDMIALRDMLIQLLDVLPPREREAVIIYTYEGNTYKETARVMGVAEGTVKGYVHDGLLRVRKYLDEQVA